MTDTNKAAGRPGERDWPQGHPSAADYDNEEYEPPPNLIRTDWPKGHPAELGKNIPESEVRERARFDAPPVVPVEPEEGKQDDAQGV